MIRRRFPSRIFLGFVLAAAGPAQASDLPQAAAQFREYYLGAAGRAEDNLGNQGHNEGRPDPALAARYVAALRPDGRWPDIDYANAARSQWLPFNHVVRMLAMAAAARVPGISADAAAPILAACGRAAAYWRAQDLQCPNWWYNDIGVPETLGKYALLLGDQLPPEDLAYINGTVLARSRAALIARAPRDAGLKMTGQNRVWVAGNALMGALLTGDEAGARTDIRAIWGEVRVTPEEGIQPDWSFHQHGPQQQFGNYGLGFAVEIGRWMTILRGTSLALPPDQAAIFRHFLLDGENWVNWRGMMELGSCGRQITPGSPRSKTSSLAHIMANQETADPAAAPRYAAFVARNRPEAANDLVGERYFWRSDYLVHRRPGVFAALKLSSARVIGGELVNVENLSGRYLADGSLLLYRRGDEYADIYPAWDWRHIPGTTTAWEPTLPRTGSAKDRVLTTWVGGASDGRDGCAAMDYDRDGVRAHKAWFFSGDRIVSLAEGITGPAGRPVHTTLNQSLHRGDIRVSAGGRVFAVPPGEHPLADVTWVEHDGWRYRFFAPAAVTVARARRVGNWRVVYQNPDTPKADVIRDVFSLWIDHGASPGGASAAWEAAPADATGAGAVLLANSAELQAVRWGADETQAAFWRPGRVELQPGTELAARQPCLVMAVREGGKWRVSVADPSQKLKQVTLSLGGRTRNVALPAGALAGSTATVDW